MSLRPPTASPSPSPGPHENGKVSARQSMGPAARGTPTLAPASPRPGGQSSARPTSELLGSGAMFQTPEGASPRLSSVAPAHRPLSTSAEALDQWFENLQNYEATLEDMAAASLDVNFKEELSAIEQCTPLRFIPSPSSDPILQGSRFSPKQSAQPLFTVFSSTRPRCRSASSSPFCSRWRGPTR